MALDQKWKLSGKTLGDPGKHERKCAYSTGSKSKMEHVPGRYGKRGRNLAMVSPVMPAHPVTVTLWGSINLPVLF